MTVESIDLARARAAFTARRSRDRVFAGHCRLFGEPAWDMLLQMFIWREEGRATVINELTAATMAYPTTAARWLDLLITEGLVARAEGTGRPATVGLTERAVALVRASLA